jgi:hypothetical protein
MQNKLCEQEAKSTKLRRYILVLHFHYCIKQFTLNRGNFIFDFTLYLLSQRNSLIRGSFHLITSPFQTKDFPQILVHYEICNLIYLMTADVVLSTRTIHLAEELMCVSQPHEYFQANSRWLPQLLAQRHSLRYTEEKHSTA